MTEIEGYGICRCGCARQELKHVLHLTRGLHWECFRGGALERLNEIVIRQDGATITITPSKRKPSRKQPTNDDRRRLTQAARQAAWKRLAQLQPDLFAVLYDDERQKRGLTIIPRRVPEGHHADAVATNSRPVG